MDKKYKMNKKSLWGLCLILAMFVSMFTVGCGKKKDNGSGTTIQTVTVITTEATTEKTADTTAESTTEATTENTTEKTTASTESPTEATTEVTTESTSEEATELTTESTSATTEEKPTETEDYPDEDGVYTSKEDVALYLYTYGKLPQNFITKKQAQKLGWSGGSLEDYAPDKCIGGDRFGNYEHILPDGNYYECDIDTLGKKSRGAKRIVYSKDGRIYYTEDHYESFTLLYGEE